MKVVHYLVVGGKHDENLVCSLLSLREHWDGPVWIWHSGGPGGRIATFCRQAFDNITLVEFRSPKRFLSVQVRMSLLKSYALEEMARVSERAVFLDCDTVVVGDLSQMFPEDDEVRLTPWNGVLTQGYKVRQRLEPFRDIAPEEVEHELSENRQAINTGVIGLSRKCLPFFETQNEMAERRPCSFIDERSCQLTYWKFPHQIMDAKFNCSPKDGWHLHGVDGTVGGEQIRGAEHPDPRVWHFYGRTAVWKPTCRFVWLPWYRKALELNVAGIREWSPSTGNGRLRRYLANPELWGPDFIERAA